MNIHTLTALPAKVCPKASPSLGASSPMSPAPAMAPLASPERAGVVGVAVVLIAAVAYMILPGMLAGITGSGCV